MDPSWSDIRPSDNTTLTDMELVTNNKEIDLHTKVTELVNNDFHSTLKSIPSHQPITKLKIQDSHDVIIGTRITADRLTVIAPNGFECHQNDSANKRGEHIEEREVQKQDVEHKKRMSGVVKTQFVFCLFYGVAIIVMITLVLVWTFDFSPKHNTTAPTIPTSRPPKIHWFVDVKNWTSIKNTVDLSYVNKIKSVLAIDNNDQGSCTDLYSCKNLLKYLQNELSNINLNINYNYVIGGDGRVYEARGNDYPPDHTADYSIDYIKIAFLGQVEDDTLISLQLELLCKLIKYLIDKEQLENDFTVQPQCCRNIPGESGPPPNVITALHQQYSSHWTTDYCNCV